MTPPTLTDLPAVHRRYDAVLRDLAAAGRGRTMRDLADAYTLAQAMEAPDLDQARELAGRLGIDLGGIR